jgi:Bacterial extracellular solute-binding protein/von Willebrand factor type A domain
MVGTGSKHAPELEPERSVASRVLTRLLAGLIVFGLLVAGAVVLLSNMGGRADDNTASGNPDPAKPRPTCDAHTLRVVADPAIADALLAATADLSEFAKDQDCLAVEVESRPSATVAAELARPAGVGLATSLPDAWIPDSSTWLDVVRRSDTGANRLSQSPQLIATSPLVLAVAADKAAERGWPGEQPAWSTMLAAPASQWRVGISDPQTSTAGLASILTVGRKSEQFASLGRRLELPSTVDRTPAQVVAEGDLDAMPTAEYDVIRTAEAGGDVVASYDPALGGALDFPLIGVTPDEEQVSDQVAADLESLKAALASPQAQATMTAAGLRTSDAVIGDKYNGEGGVPVSGAIGKETAAPLKIVGSAATEALKNWSSVGRRSRLLILLDLSGSMDFPLPGGKSTKIELARKSLSKLVESSAPDSDLGLWTFTTNGKSADGTDRIVKVGSLGDEVADGQNRRDRLSDVLAKLKVDPDGGTPLYRAVLAAYTTALDNYAFGRYNAVIVVTDGRDEDSTRTPIPVADVLNQLRRQYDGIRPVEIISLAYGEEVDADILRQISDVTGGSSYQGSTQKQVNRILFEALANS